MSDALPVYDLPADPEEAGAAHGRALAEFFRAPFLDAYLSRLGGVTRTERDDLQAQAMRWLSLLPQQYRAEITGMARGAGSSVRHVASFLYADIAAPTASDGAGAAYRPGVEREILSGPGCSAALVEAGDSEGARGGTWVARNCDWLRATLVRGTAAVVHRTPHRIPVIGFGIRGDIDIDTGMNAERLWVHLHTLPGKEDPPRNRTTISWLFWAREALETCSTLDELERFIAATGRDRGVLVIAAEGATGASAVFACDRASHVRHDREAAWLAVTNHEPDRHLDAARASRSRAGSTIARCAALRGALAAGVEAPPRGLMGLLGREDVEMRRPRELRTIYAAVANPSMDAVWFASGDASGRPAASGGRWGRVEWGW